MLLFRFKVSLKILAFVRLTMNSQKTEVDSNLLDYHWILVMKIHLCLPLLDRYVLQT